MKNHYDPILSPEEAERRHRAYVEGGRKGGSAPHKTRWFSEHPELARKWGSVGGKKSKRGKKNEE